jgi:uncharacterized protein
MKRNTGSYVSGDNFFGRKKELKKMDYIISNPNSSIIIPGPRRIGKSSLVQEFKRLNEEKYKIIYLDIEKSYSILQFCSDLKHAIEKDHFNFSNVFGIIKNSWNAFAQAIQEIEIGGAKIKTGKIDYKLESYLSKLEDVLSGLNKQNYIFAFDEFSDFLLSLKKTSIEDVHFFLKWMRELRQTNKIRLIISGSINIITTAEEMNVSDLINDFEEIEILPLNENEIKELLRKLLEDTKIPITEESLNYALTKVGDGIPFFIQMFADALAYYNQDDIKEYDIKTIESTYNKIINKKHQAFNDLHDRLKDYLIENERRAAWIILAHLSYDKMSFDDLYPFVSDVLSTKEELIKLLNRLVDESYLSKDLEFYSFRSVLLSDWWKNNYSYERN